MKSFFIFLLISVHSLAWSQSAQMIDLGNVPMRLSTHEQSYEDFFMSAPNFSVYQSHQGLADLMDKSGKSQLCFPAALANALINLYQNSPVLQEKMSLPGLSADKKKIDANELVRDLVLCAQTDVEVGTTATFGANCILDYFKKYGVHVEVKLIRTLQLMSESPELLHIVKEPSPQDIVDGLKAGYTAIPLIGRFTLKDDHWTRASGHFFNIFGYGRNSNWPADLDVLYVTNPGLIYRPYGLEPQFDMLMTGPLWKKSLDSEQNSNYYIEGNGFLDVTYRAFFDAVILFKVLP